MPTYCICKCQCLVWDWIKKWIEWTINVNYGIHIATNRTKSQYELTIKLFYWCAHICHASIKSYNFVIFFSFIIVQCTGYLKRVWIVTVDRGGIIMLSRNTLNTLCFITAHSYVRYWRYLAFLNYWLIKYKSRTPISKSVTITMTIFFFFFFFFFIEEADYDDYKNK